MMSSFHFQLQATIVPVAHNKYRPDALYNLIIASAEMRKEGRRSLPVQSLTI
jgi:hypothetical protein